MQVAVARGEERADGVRDHFADPYAAPLALASGGSSGERLFHRSSARTCRSRCRFASRSSPSSRHLQRSPKKSLFHILVASVLRLDCTESEVLDPDLLTEDYVCNLIRLSVVEIKFRLVVDQGVVNNSTGPRRPQRRSEKVLCCAFLNRVSFLLRTGYDWWEVVCSVNNLELKDFTNDKHKQNYLIRRNSGYYSSGHKCVAGA